MSYVYAWTGTWEPADPDEWDEGRPWPPEPQLPDTLRELREN